MKAKYLSIFAIFAALAFTSCNDFLDKNPDTRVELVNVEQLRQLLIDGYTNESYAVVGELSSDNVIDNNSPSNEGVRYNLGSYSLADEEIFAWEDVRAATDNDSPSGIWNGCYHAIAVANAVLEKGEQMIADGTLNNDDRAKLDAVMAEAYLIRSYHHFLLVNIFCMPYGKTSASDQGIPYATKPETTVNPHYERGTVAQDYEMIEKDLVAGLAKVSDQYYEQPKYHFNKQAAYAFAARFYLFKREYAKVIEYANLCFEGYDPAALMNDIWGKAGAYYYISDMGRYYTNVARPGNFLNINTYSTWWRRFVSSGRYACNREAKRATIQGPGPTWENCRWRNSKGDVFSMHPCFNGFCGDIYGDSEYGSYFAGNMCEQFEYTDKIQGIGYCHVVRSEFTAEETLLCRAEAKAFMNDFEGCVADLKIWDEARKIGVSSTSSMIPMTGAAIERFYAKVFPILGHPEFVEMVEKTPAEEQIKPRRSFMPAIEEAFKTKTADEWVRIFLAADVVITKIALGEELYQSEQGWANGFLQKVEYPNGHENVQPNSPVKFAGLDVKTSKHVGGLGADTREVLEGLGYSAAQIAAMAEKKSIIAK